MMSFPDLLLRGSAKLALASYEYRINTYSTPLLYVTGNQPVWSEYTFTESNTDAKTILFPAFPGFIVIGTCVDLSFFLLCSSSFALWRPT